MKYWWVGMVVGMAINISFLPKEENEPVVAVWAVSPYGRKIWALNGSSDSKKAHEEAQKHNQ